MGVEGEREGETVTVFGEPQHAEAGYLPPVARRALSVYRHFGLAQEPFAPAPDPAMWHTALGHADGLARVRDALMQPRGLIAVLGGEGYGKSALRAALLAALRRERLAVEIAALDDPRPYRTDAALLRAALARFGLPLDGRAGTAHIRQLTRFVETSHLRGRGVLLVLDDAHLLTGPHLDLLHALLAAAPTGAASLHLLLLGTSALAERIARRGSLGDHLGVAHTLNPLNRDDTAGLIAHRLRVAGWAEDAPSLFTPEATDAVYVATGGVPAAVVTQCAACLVEARFSGATRVDDAVVRAALNTPSDGIT